MSKEKKPRRFGRARDKPVENRSGGNTGFFFGGSHAGIHVNETTALQYAAVYACVRILAEAVAGLPLHTFRLLDNGDRRKATDHPLYRLLHDEPNAEMSSFTFRETLMSHLLMWGNGYAQVVRNGHGQVLGLYPLLPSKMDVGRAADGSLVYTYWRDSEESSPNQRRGQALRFRADEVLHIPGLSFDGLIGYSPIAMARNAVGLGIASEDYGATFFANGAQPSGVLEHPKTMSDPEALRKAWTDVYGGVDNANRVAILEEGMTYKPISLPPDQAQFLETRKFQIIEIARIFRIPPHMIAELDRATFSNVEHQSLDFVKFTLGPWLARWEQELRRKLLLPGEKDRLSISFNVDGLLRGDYKSRMEGYAVGIEKGFFSANDVLRLENMNLIPAALGGDDYVLNGSYVRRQDVGLAYQTGKESESG